MTRVLRLSRLTKSVFSPFGDVIDVEDAERLSINAGTTTRFHDLANIDVADGGGRPIMSIFRGEPRAFPFDLELMERHPLGSQAFFPLSGRPFVIVVAASRHSPRFEDLRGFVSGPGQGVNYAKNIWHHPLIAIGARSDFLVVDRDGPGDNLEESPINGEPVAIARPEPGDE